MLAPQECRNIIDRCFWLGHMEAHERLTSANPGPLKDDSFGRRIIIHTPTSSRRP
jgi:hypothetical protein